MLKSANLNKLGQEKNMKIVLFMLLAYFTSTSILTGDELKAVLKLKNMSFTLDKTMAEKVLEAGKVRGQRSDLPQPAVVNGQLILKNEGTKHVTINVGGDKSMINLRLKGDGALTLPSMYR